MMLHSPVPGRHGRRGLRRFALVGMVLLALLLGTHFAAGASIGDATGALTGTAKDAMGADGKLTLESVADAAGKAKISLNFVWVLMAGFLVFLMQAGFMLVETGFTRAKNAAHTATVNFMVFLVGCLGFYFIGFPLMMGGVGSLSALGGHFVLGKELTINGWGILGWDGWFLSGKSYDVGVFAIFLFQMVFMDTTVTIPTGAMAERVKYLAVVLSSLIIATVIYPVYGNWVWGAGWLSQLGSKLGLGHGAVDFAGSGVVHAMGGMIAIAGALILGPRFDKFRKDGSPRPIPGHDIPMGILGTIILYFGWFGFNAGSTLAGTDLRLAVVAVNTMLAGAAGGVTAMVYMWTRHGKPDPSMTCNGGLAGLVAITAPCAFVSAPIAVLIGAIAGVLVCISVYVVEHKFRIDDPVGAISVHGVNGLFGLLALGLFADGTYGDGWNGVSGTVRGLFYGDSGQFVAQLINMGVVITFGLTAAWLMYKFLDKTIGLRVSPRDEILGLDMPEMGAAAYPEFGLGDGMGMDTIPSIVRTSHRSGGR